MNKLLIQIKLIISVIIVCFCFSQDEVRINNIKVVGNTRLSDDDIIRISNIYPGMNIVGDEIQRGIKKLWDLERFNDIQIILDNENKMGIDIIIEVQEANYLDEIVISGNKKIGNNKIDEILGLESGQLITVKNIFESKNKLIAEYKDRGYYNISVEDSIYESNSDFASNIKLIIKEGKKVKIKNIIFNQSFYHTSENSRSKKSKWYFPWTWDMKKDQISSSRIKRLMKSNKEWKWYIPWRGKLKEDEIDSDKALIKSYFNNKGYKDFFLSNDKINLEGNSLTLSFDLYQGSKYIYRNISWNGNEIFDDSTLTDAINIRKGDRFNNDQFSLSLFQNVSSLYMDKGYINLSLNHSFKYIGQDSLDVIFDLVENDVVRVRNIIIKGNYKTNDNVIRREIDIYPGDIFNRTKFIDVRTKIMLLNFFENVIPDILPVDEDEVDLVIEVMEKGVGQANFSMGWNKVQGFNGGGGFQLPNFLGKGQTISLNYNRGLSNNSNYSHSGTSSSTISQSFSLSFFEPALYDTPNMIGVSMSYYENPASRTISGLDINGQSISLSFGRRKLNWPDDKFKITWVFTNSLKTYSSYDETKLFNIPYVNEGNIYFENNKYNFESRGVSLSQVLKRKSLNHPEFPTNGSEFTWDLTYSGGKLGGIEDYIKNVFSLNWFMHITDKITIGNLFRFGSIEKTSENSVIPPQRYFVMGGVGIPYGEMLRGYPENSVGPYYYENNYPVGGKLLTRYSLEFRVLFSESPTMYGFVFTDVGNVWSNYDSIDPFDLKRSAGFGVRLFMPMLGQIGYDIGYGFDSSSYGEDSSPWGWDHHLIFGMGLN